MTQTINKETVNNRAKLLMHRLVARRISKDPELITVVRRNLKTGPRSLKSNKEWLRILDRDPKEVCRLITSRSQEMERLRISSPFSIIAGLQDPVIRKRIWKIAKKGNRQTRPLDASQLKKHGQLDSATSRPSAYSGHQISSPLPRE